MPPGLQVPTVTQEDLYAFHTKVFGANDPHQPVHDVDPRVYNEEQDYYEEEEDDGLGYYPDGRKRTLTDKQIAMFRHSEIYAILRERQVRQENEEAERMEREDSNSVSGLSPLNGEEAQAVAPVPVTGSEIVSEQPPEPDAPANVVTKPINFHQDTNGTNESSRLLVNPMGSPTILKRKWDSLEAKENYERPPPSRREIRELDSASAADVELDYGGETPHADASSSTPEGRSAAPEGRKIWWPVIEG